MSEMYVKLLARGGAGLAELEAALGRKNFARIRSGSDEVYHYMPGLKVRFSPESVSFNYEHVMSFEDHRAGKVNIPVYLKNTLELALEHVEPVGVHTHAGDIGVDALRKELGIRKKV